MPELRPLKPGIKIPTRRLFDEPCAADWFSVLLMAAYGLSCCLATILVLYKIGLLCQN